MGDDAVADVVSTSPDTKKLRSDVLVPMAGESPARKKFSSFSVASLLGAKNNGNSGGGGQDLGQHGSEQVDLSQRRMSPGRPESATVLLYQRSADHRDASKDALEKEEEIDPCSSAVPSDDGEHVDMDDDEEDMLDDEDDDEEDSSPSMISPSGLLSAPSSGAGVTFPPTHHQQGGPGSQLLHRPMPFLPGSPMSNWAAAAAAAAAAAGLPGGPAPGMPPVPGLPWFPGANPLGGLPDSLSK
jgi:hypothetical protein